jgi:hypothetical protein
MLSFGVERRTPMQVPCKALALRLRLGVEPYNPDVFKGTHIVVNVGEYHSFLSNSPVRLRAYVHRDSWNSYQIKRVGTITEPLVRVGML